MHDIVAVLEQRLRQLTVGSVGYKRLKAGLDCIRDCSFKPFIDDTDEAIEAIVPSNSESIVNDVSLPICQAERVVRMQLLLTLREKVWGITPSLPVSGDNRVHNFIRMLVWRDKYMNMIQTEPGPYWSETWADFTLIGGTHVSTESQVFQIDVVKELQAFLDRIYPGFPDVQGYALSWVRRSSDYDTYNQLISAEILSQTFMNSVDQSIARLESAVARLEPLSESVTTVQQAANQIVDINNTLNEVSSKLTTVSGPLKSVTEDVSNASANSLSVALSLERCLSEANSIVGKNGKTHNIISSINMVISILTATIAVYMALKGKKKTSFPEKNEVEVDIWN